MDGVSSLDVIADLWVPLGERLWQTYRNDPAAPKLIFADSRSGTRRVSEQEPRVLMCVLLEQAGWYYSVETPTVETYQQGGTYALSARDDLTVHGSRRSSDRILNVEFKAGTPPVEIFRKGLEKLTREGIPGLWFHTLENATPRKLTALALNMRDAWALLREHGSIATHDIHFAICVLDPAVIFTTRLILGNDLDTRLHTAFAEGLTGWDIHAPDAAAWPPVKKLTQSARARGTGPASRSGFSPARRSRLTLCCTSTVKAIATGCESSASVQMGLAPADPSSPPTRQPSRSWTPPPTRWRSRQRTSTDWDTRS
ncbi:hypothetical protein [Microbacterium sp.]|uniref:hypothetical protein n=1 Tax=Microbacterium sp. TaxID=51671 RepID=UPI003C1E153D